MLLSKTEKIEILSEAIDQMKSAVDTYRQGKLYGFRGICYTLYSIIWKERSLSLIQATLEYSAISDIFGLDQYQPNMPCVPTSLHWFPLNEDGALKRIEILEDILSKLQDE